MEKQVRSMKYMVFTKQVTTVTYFCLLLMFFVPTSIPDEGQSASERSPEEWIILFDGTSTEHFRGWDSEIFPEKGWKIEGDCLKCEKSNGRPNGGGGDIVTKDSYDNFELSWEWKISSYGNSGMKYMVCRRKNFISGQELFRGDDGKSLVGLEYQMIDDIGHPDAKNGPARKTASLYQVIAPENAKTRPGNEFNESRILVKKNHVEHWLNGVKVLEYELGSKDILSRIEKSKYRFIDGFGSKIIAPILFQDHGDELLLRNIRIRGLTKNLE